MTPPGSTKREGTATLWLVATMCLVALVGCRSGPSTPGGESLRCSEDTDCPDDLRCSGGGCVFNSPPAVGPFSATTVFVGTPVTVDADAESSDADGDPITNRWAQVEGPMLLPQPTPDGVLDVIPTDPGTYTFEVTSDDGRGGETVARFTVIVINPELQPFQRLFTAINQPVSVTARAIEPENAPVVVEWTLAFGPGAPGTPSVSDTLDFTPDTLGRYVFDVRVLGEPVPRTRLEVIVQPTAEAVYVNGSAIVFDPSAVCGAFDTPCLTLQDGVARARSLGLETILIAGHPPGQPYDACVALEGNELLQGGFDPDTWAYDPDRLRDSTRIRCPAAAGVAHTFIGTSQIADVTLRLAGQEAPIVSTVLVQGSPTIENVDVVLPICGTFCTSVGIGGLEANVTLTGVNIQADNSGFAIVGSVTGVVLAGGNPVIQGATAVRAADDTTSRGKIALDVPATGFANGIVLARTQSATVQGILLEGGFGANIVGVTVTGGDATVAGNVIDMTAFGALTVIGIAGTDCGATDANCGCSGVACPGITEPILHPDLEARGNVVRIRSSAGASGQVPCAGAALFVGAGQTGQTMDGNDVQVLGPFALGVGVIMDTNQALAVGEPDSVNSNTIVVEEGRADALCEGLGFASILGLGNGVFGIVAAAAEADIGGNVVSVGAHDEVSGAFAAIAANGLQVHDNVFEVASSEHTARTSTLATGAQVTGAAGGVPSLFTRNRVFVRDATVSSVGIRTDGSPWIISNNFIVGGEGFASVGLRLETTTADPDWPRVVHNTIYAGGASANVSTTAVQVASPMNSGMFLNNLLDGGESLGRRMLFHALGTGSFDTLQGNYGQFPPRTGGGLNPAAVAKPIILTGEGQFEMGMPGVSQIDSPAWNVYFQGSGQVIALEPDEDMGVLGERAYAFLDRPTNGVWIGETAGTQVTLAWDESTFYVSEIISGRPEEFAPYPTGGPQPLEAVVGDVDSDTADIVFIAGEDLYWMQALSRLSFDTAVPLELSRGDLRARALTTIAPSRDVFVLASSATDTFIERYPRNSAENEMDSIDITSAIPGNAGFRWIGAERFDGDPAVDLMIAHGNELDIFLNPSFVDAVGTWVAETFTQPVCGGTGPIAAQGADFGPVITQKVIIVQCLDAVEAYFFPIAGDMQRATWEDAGSGSSGNSLRPTAGVGVVRFDRQAKRLFVAGPGGDITLYGITNPFGTTQLVYDPVSSGLVEADGAYRDTTSAEVYPAFGDGLAGQLDPAGVPVTLCPLEIRAGNPDDLHLATDANPCIDGGADLSELAEMGDIDGPDTRAGATPDVGADERVP